MALPFVVDPPLSVLPNLFPDPGELRAAVSGTRRAREIVVRLWLTEGPPFAFRNCPAVYEDLRGWLGSRLAVHPKQITLVGSARFGYSLAPPPDFGKPFGVRSDLDLSVVSPSLFDRIVEAFQLFANDYREGRVAPRNAREGDLWDANLEFGERNIPLGFLDTHKVPNFDRYAGAQQVNQAMWALVAKLRLTPGAPSIRRASTRVFRDWQCLIERASLNLRAALPVA